MISKVSVIIPIYNSEETIERCLNSVINQTYKNIEIILINDGSTDNSEQIIKKFVDDRIIYKKYKNHGVSVSRNNGISISTGDYIIFVDSDDYLDENMIEKLIFYSSNYTICSFYKVNGNKIKPFKKFTQKVYNLNINQNFWYLYNVQEAINRPWGKLYKTSIIKKNNIKFDENVSLGEDLLFNLNYLKNISEIIMLDEGLYYYSIGNDNSLGKKYRKNMLDIQFILKTEFLNYTSQLNLERKISKKVYIRSLRFLLNAATNELHSGKKNKLHHMRKIMCDEKVQSYAKKLYNNKKINFVQYFIVAHGMVLSYLILRNILYQ